MGPRHVGIMALGIAVACAGRAPEPPPSERASASDVRAHVLVPEQAVALRRTEAATYAGLAATGADVAWPSPTAPLAIGAAASKIAALARPVFAAREADVRRAALLAAMDAHPEQLTADGLYLRAVLIATDDEARFEAALDRDPEAHVDTTRTIAASAQYLDRFPDDAHRPEAHYLHAWASAAMATAAAQSRAAAQEYLVVAASDSALAIDADLRAGDYFFLDDGSHDALVLAAQAYGALVDSTQPRADRLRPQALERLGVVLARLGDLAHARARLCALDAMPNYDVNAESRLADTFDEARDVDVLRTACAANTCPCVATVVEGVADFLVDDDDAVHARPIIELVLSRFPGAADVGTLRCARAAFDDATVAGCGPPPPPSAGTDLERAVREARSAAGVRSCGERAWRNRVTLDGAATFELTIGARGAVTDTRATTSTLPAALTACVAEALGRHRWRGLDGRVLELPLRFADPD